MRRKKLIFISHDRRLKRSTSDFSLFLTLFFRLISFHSITVVYRTLFFTKLFGFVLASFFFLVILLQYHKTNIRERASARTKKEFWFVIVYVDFFFLFASSSFMRLWLASTITDHCELLLIHIRTDTCTLTDTRRKRRRKDAVRVIQF